MAVVPLPPPVRPVEEEEEERPTLCLVGTDPMSEALAAALDRHGAVVERCAVDGVSERVFVSAPDAVVLIGDAAEDDGQTVLKQLSARLATAVIPAILVSSDPTLESRISAFRYGAVAVVQRSASVDEMARHIAEKAKELPERGEAMSIGEASVDELVDLFSRRLRSGLLAVTAPGAGPDASARVVLRGDGNVTETIEELVRRVRPLVAHAEPLQIEFQESPTGKLRGLGLVDEPSVESDLSETLSGRRLLLVEKSPARADELVQVLRDLKARVVVVDGEGEGLERARAVDPDVVVVDETGVGGWAARTLQAIRHDVRLRWASLLVVKGDELWPAGQKVADVPRLSAGIRPLVAPDDALTARAKLPGAFEVRLESTGPVRLLRAVARSERTLHLLVRGAKARVEIDVAEGLVVGATARGQGTEKTAGPGAIATLLAISSARVRIEPRQAPKVANLMCPVDDAVAASLAEAPLVRPSLPPPSLPPPRPAGGAQAGGFEGQPTPSRPIDARELLGQLESMLERLKTALPEGARVTAAPAASGHATLAGLPAPPARDPLPAPPVAAPPAGAMPRPGRVPKRTLLGVAAPSMAAPAAATTSATTTAPFSAAVGPPSTTELPPPPAPPASASTLTASPFADAAAVAQPSPFPPMPPGPPSALPPSPFSATVVGSSAPSMSADPRMPVAAEPPPPPAFGSSMFDLPVTTVRPPPSLDGHSFSSGSTVAPMFASAELTPILGTGLPVEPAEEALPTRRGGRTILVVLAILALLLALGGGGWAVFVAMQAPSGVAAVPLPTPALPTTVGTGPTPPISVVPPDPSTLVAPVAVVPPEVDAGAVALAFVADPVVTPEIVPPIEVDEDPTLAGAVDPTATSATADEEAAAAAAAEVAVEDAAPEVAEPRARDALVAQLIHDANYARSHGDADGAESGYLHVLRLDRANARALAGLARLYQARGEPRTALFWSRRLTTLHPEMPANHVLLGDLLEATGDHAGARAAWERALAISPSHGAARRRLAGEAGGGD